MAFNFIEKLGTMFGQRVAERVLKPREQPAETPSEAEAPAAEASPEAATDAPAPESTAIEASAPAEGYAEPAPAETYTATTAEPVSEAAPITETPSSAPTSDASATAPAPAVTAPATDVAATTTEEAPAAAADASVAPHPEVMAEAAPEAPAEPARSAEEIEEERLWNETDAAWASGDFAKVTELLDQLKALQPEDAAAIDEKIAAAQYNQASAFEQAGELDRALYLYQEAQRRNPNLGEAAFAIERVQAALSPPAEPEAAAEPAPAEQTYTVEGGDSLWTIAERFYGDGSQFSRIFEANRDQLDNPDVIHPGQVLRIPS